MTTQPPLKSRFVHNITIINGRSLNLIPGVPMSSTSEEPEHEWSENAT